MTLREVEERVRNMGWPAPSADLRARVLAAAPTAARPIAWSDRVWYSRTWRMGMAATALVVAVLNLRPGEAMSHRVEASPKQLAQLQVIEETSQQAGLSPDAAAALARRALRGLRSAPREGGAWLDLATFDEAGDKQ